MPRAPSRRVTPPATSLTAGDWRPEAIWVLTPGTAATTVGTIRPAVGLEPVKQHTESLG